MNQNLAAALLNGGLSILMVFFMWRYDRMSELKALIAPENVVRFRRYFEKQLWYQVFRPLAGDKSMFVAVGPEFPVPIDDIGSATFLDEDRAILFMRYIRKHLKVIEDARAEVVPEAPPAPAKSADLLQEAVEVVYFPKKG